MTNPPGAPRLRVRAYDIEFSVGGRVVRVPGERLQPRVDRQFFWVAEWDDWRWDDGSPVPISERPALLNALVAAASDADIDLLIEDPELAHRPVAKPPDGSTQ